MDNAIIIYCSGGVQKSEQIMSCMKWNIPWRILMKETAAGTRSLLLLKNHYIEDSFPKLHPRPWLKENRFLMRMDRHGNKAETNEQYC